MRPPRRAGASGPAAARLRPAKAAPTPARRAFDRRHGGFSGAGSAGPAVAASVASPAERPPRAGFHRGSGDFTPRMGRFVAILDWSHAPDLSASLRRAREVLTHGGGRERAFEIVRPPFAALALTHHGAAPFVEEGDEVRLAAGFGPPPAAETWGFLARCGAHLRRPAAETAGVDLPVGPMGRQVLLRWSAGEGQLTVVAEPNGQAPAFAYLSPELAIVASEPKAIWALCRGALTPGADALADLMTYGQPLGEHTLFAEVRALEPGTVHGIGHGRAERRTYLVPSFSDARGGDADALADALNRALLETLAAQREATPRVTVALSGGMDSRYALAGARRVWSEVDAFTFGAPGSWDVALAGEVARRAGIAQRHRPPAARFLPDWAGYAAWRTDGLLGCLHAQGMDAMIAQSGRARFVVNGIGGDVLLGSFLRPGHVLAPGDATRAADFVARQRRFHARPLEDVLKPEWLERAQASPRETLAGIMRRYAGARLGNTLHAYWLRHHCARISVMGLALEAPWVEYVTPLVDPLFVRSGAAVPLELRFMTRAYRRALTRLAPELARVRWERVGLAPRWPWPALFLGKLGLRLGWLRRPPPAGGHPLEPGTAAWSWLEDLLLEPDTLAEGFFVPSYLRAIVGEHGSGRSAHTAELGMAVTLELWRRLFVEGRTDLALPPSPDA